MNPSVPVPTSYPKLDSAPDGTFSIVVIPDTQAYLGDCGGDGYINPVFAAHVRWIEQNLCRQKIVFVSHVGDIVDKADHSQWQLARSLMDHLHGLVPYGFSPGNKDMTPEGDSSLFQTYFPAARFAGCPWYGGCFPGSPHDPGISGNNANSFQRFEGAGLQLLFLHLECNAPDNVLVWANAVLDAHRDRVAFVTCHMGLGPLHLPSEPDEFFTAAKGRMTWSKIHGERGNSPQEIWDKCYRRHPHLYAVFSGDQVRTQAIRRSSCGDFGNAIHEFTQDYATGWLRLYRFQPHLGKLRVITFAPLDETLCLGTALVPDPSEHNFEVPFPNTLNDKVKA